jgi:membrane protease YdiL (CAAX protease family)
MPFITEQFAREIALIALILLYGTVLAKLVPPKYHIFLNIFIAVIAILLGYGFGLSLSEMGIGAGYILKGILIALALSAIITLATLIIALIPFLRHFFLGEDLAHAKGPLIAFEAAIRIPFSTALVEEVLFRGVLLGLLLTHYPTIIAITYAAIVFGLWHIFPTIKSLEHNDAAASLVGDKKSRQTIGVLGAVTVTTIAGLLFGYARVLANSIVAPWLIHWSINASGVLGVYVAKKLQNKKEN